MSELDLSEFELDEIESIELMGEEETVDITVDDTHMFYANDIYTHNSSIGAEVVDATQMSGSIKKGMIGHFIVSVAKTLQQKEEGTATMAILKSRFGKDGIIFKNCIFNNGTINIETVEDDGLSFTNSAKVDKEEENDTISKIMLNVELRKKKINGESNE